MTQIEIERSLEKAVAEALGVELPKHQHQRRRASRRIEPANTRRHEDRHVHA